MSLKYTARAAFEQGRPEEALARLRRIQDAYRKGWLADIGIRGLDQQIGQLEKDIRTR